jgi:hypothetical protein
MGGHGLRALVFTAPPGPDGSWDHVTWSRAGELRALARRVVRDWYRATWALDVGGYAVVHPSGDKCASCGKKDRQDHKGAAVFGRCLHCDAPARWRPHVHVGVAGAGVCTRTGKVLELPRHLSLGELSSLRAAWSAAVRDLYATWSVPCAGVAVLHYAHRRAGPETVHRLKYDLRPWPAWHGGQGAKSASILRLTTFGLCAPNARNRSIDRWRKAVSVEPPEPEEAPPCACPLCGSDVTFRGVGLLNDLAAFLQVVAWEEDIRRLERA